MDEVNAIPEALWNAEYRAQVHRDTSSVFVKGYPPVAERADDEDRLILRSLPYVREIIYSKLPGTPQKCLIAKLLPNGVIKLHPDGARKRTEKSATIYDYFKSTIRIHIPLRTNDKVHFFVGSQFYHFKQGEAWAINNLRVHGVLNSSTTEVRIHLIVDVVPDTDQQLMLGTLPEAVGWTDDAALRRLYMDDRRVVQNESV